MDKQHFFVTTALEWRTFKTLEQAQKWARKQEHATIVRVPLPLDALYQIRQYTPVVDGIEIVERIGH